MVTELRSCRVSGVTACDRVPANLPEGCAAVRCYVRTASGATTTVVLGGPAEGDCTLDPELENRTHRQRRQRGPAGGGNLS